jgi:ABC-type nitrate/sulfonate/bicarbonate transport system substrate-binding protein
MQISGWRHHNDRMAVANKTVEQTVAITMLHDKNQNTRLTRRKLLKRATSLYLAATTGTSLAASSNQSSSVILRSWHLTVTGYYRGPAFLVASQKGYFSEQNLDVEFYLVQLAPEHNRGMAEGRWPISLSSADTMLARATQDNIDFLLFMQAEEGLDVQLVARPGIVTFSDLRSKRFAADPVDSNYDLIRNKIMRDNGIAESEYEVAILGNSKFRAAALDDRRVDAAMLQPPFSERAVKNGNIVLAQGSQYISNWAIVCGWGLRSWIENNRPTVVRFVRAMARATDWALDPNNKQEVIDLLMRVENVSLERAERNYRQLVPHCMIKGIRLPFVGTSSIGSSLTTTNLLTNLLKRFTIQHIGPKRRG